MSNRWSGTVRPTALFTLNGFASQSGALFTARCPRHIPNGDVRANPRRSRLLLLEDGKLLGPAHSNHAHISDCGGGAFSHWAGTVYLSASDNSDPRTNGRTYQGVWAATESNPKIEDAQEILRGLKYDYSTDEAYAAIEDILAVLYPAARIGDDKKIFWLNEQLLQDYRRLIGTNMRSLERKVAVLNLVRALDHVEGDLAECGSFEGATAYFIAQADREAGRKRPLHLFDSFEGLSSPDPIDGAHWHKGDLSASEEKLKANLAKFEHVSVYKGWIPNEFHHVEERRFAFVHLDVDLYQPTKDALDFFYPRVKENGIILCDDSGFTTCPGATKAMVEFFSDKPERIISLPSGQDFIIKRK